MDHERDERPWGRYEVLWDAPSHKVKRIEVRPAIEVRDRTCFHPYCDEVPERPEIDHILEYAKGGLTTQQGGRLGCDFHNRWRNHHPDHPAGPDPPGR